MLTVIEEAKDENGNSTKSHSGSILWRCVCDCGNETVVSSNALRSCGTLSCGCLSSKNEMIIQKHLEEINVQYKKQYYYDDLRSPITGYLLKFDIGVLDKNKNISFIIEYDGEQHEYGLRFSNDKNINEEKFKRTKLYDKIKDEYCKNNNIDLLRISFRDKEKMIEIIDNKLKQKGLL